MPILDAGIYNALGQGQKSALDYAEQYAAADDRRNQRAMNALQMQQVQQGIADDQAQRAALSGLSPDATTADRVKALRATNVPKAWSAADALETGDLTRRETAAKVAKSEWEVRKDKTDYAWRAIGAATTPEAAAQQISEGLKQGHFTMEEASRSMAELQQIGNDPAAYQKWRTGKVMALLNAHDQISATAAKPTEIRLGDRVVMVDLNPNSPTYKQQISSANIGQSPDSVAATGLGYAKLKEEKRHNDITEKQAGQAVTYQQDANGNFFALPSKVDPGSSVRATPVMGPGGVQPLVGSGGNKTLNDSQSKAYLFGSRMQAADEIINKMSKDGVYRGGNINAIASSVPLIGGIGDSLTNWTQSSEQQQVMQAKRDFMTAALRRESGASISPSEFETFDKTYFPQIGESDEVIKNKAELRKRAIEGTLAEVPQNLRPAASASPSKSPKVKGIKKIED